MTSEEKFAKAVDFVFSVEGYYSNDPYDTGGETKYGISQKWNPEISVKDLTVDGAKDVYKKSYWDKAKCDQYPWPLAACVFDAAVQHGVYIATLMLKDNGADWTDYNLARLERYVATCNKSADAKKYYMLGWMNRLVKLNKMCMMEEKNVQV